MLIFMCEVTMLIILAHIFKCLVKVIFINSDLAYAIFIQPSEGR